MVGAGYTEREVCDGQGLSSPGRWSQEDRLYPSSSLWLQIQRMFIHTAETMTTSRHLSELALGRLTSSPFSEKTVTVLRDDLFRLLSDSGHGIVRSTQDRRELPFDFRLFLILLSSAGYPEVKMCVFAFGVRVGPGTKLPRCTHHRSLHRLSRITVNQAHCESLSSVCFAQEFQRAIPAHRNQTRIRMVTKRNQCSERQASER